MKYAAAVAFTIGMFYISFPLAVITGTILFIYLKDE